jgi:RTX calcium-binding nonapeptide repeat (4 copies)
MHRRLALLTATILLALAVPALAQPTFTPACASDDACLGLAQPADADSVVVAWRTQTTSPQTVQLRSTQTLESGTATTATGAPIAIGTSNAVQSVSERLPIAAGGELELLDSSGTPQFEAVLEPDGDGDGYGDSTQDACPGNAADHTAPCDGTATIGSPLTLAPDPHGFSGLGNPIEVLQLSAGGTLAAMSAPGVLTRWRLRSTPTAGDTVLQLLRPDGAGTAYTVVAESAPVHVTSAAVVTVEAQVPVQVGDRIAARSVAAVGGGSSDLGALAARPADTVVKRQPPTMLNAVWTPPISGTDHFRLLIQADVEPDANHNGKGDVTQEPAVAPPPPYIPNIPPAAPFVIKPCANIIRGTRDDDVVRGTAFGDRLVGGDGDDLLKGQGADDCLEGGTGDDVLDGGDGNDRLAGSSGRDRLSGGTGDDKLTGGKGNDRLTGGPGNDTISPGSGRDVVDAGGGNDTINSVDGVKETIDCGAGKDTVRADKRDRLKHCEKVTRR